MPNRREFLQSAGAATAGAALVPYFITSPAARAAEESKNDRHVIGCIGTGDRWEALQGQAKQHGDIVAVCDVDRAHVDKAAQRVGGKPEKFEDYRRVLDRKDIEAVIIATPDHWHVKIAIEAMQAGKDVYCEKPLTLTIDEGKKICAVQKQTNRVFQVGTQQRSEFSTVVKKGKEASTPKFEHQFLLAVALAHSGRLGRIERVTCSIGECNPCEPLAKVSIPDGLNWEMWLGQTPLVDYVQGGKSPSNPKYPASRCHYEFRWWYEYSGGKLTDWGAHHVDIAQWAIGMLDSGPTKIEATAELPVPYKDGHPTVDNQYNTPSHFNVRCSFPNRTEMIVRDGPDNGIWIEGDRAEIFVNRDTLRDIRGDVVASLADKPVPEEDILKLCKGKKPGSHMGNFFECVRDRSEPFSDVHTHHRAMTTCHLANIAIRLKRPLKWDSDKEEIVGDSDANGWLARQQRKGYEINV
jgi:predicted dehydrogenase